ncbi:MAG: ATP-binding protein [Bacteroidaceae bacterium]|nr:ATP-binding protein [Bacteroidaceae bacterium]
MAEETNFIPRKVTNPNDCLDRKSYLCICGLFCDSRAITDEIKYHDKTSNIDGFVQLIDENDYPIGNIFIQAKTYKSKYKGQNKAEIPAYFVAYAMRMRNEVCIFFSVDADDNKIYWKYISDDYIRQFNNEGDNEIHTYEFYDDEIVTSKNVATTIDRWKQIFNDKIAQLTKEEKSTEEVMTESCSAFQRINTYFHDLKDSFVERKEIDILCKWVKEELQEKESCVKLLVGNAGMGKSVIIKKVIQRLNADGIRCFAIKADKLQTPVGYSSNEHLELLRNTFSSLIQEKRAVLIIDQIDALSQYINSDRSKLENITALIRLFSDDKNMRNVRIIVSCRSFDLDFDPKLSLLGREPQIKLGLLSKEDVEKVLDRLEEGLYRELDDKTKTVLQTPQHLNLFCRVYAKNKKKEYYSITELYDELWLQTIGLAEAKINKEIAEKILYDLALKIYDDETLTPQWDYDTSELKEANFLISEGIIERNENRATFFHQSMYDYVFARYYKKEKRSLIQDLLEKKKHQGIFMRSTVNFVLDYERAKNAKQYKEDVNNILFSGKIRTHIQLMLLWAMANRVDILPFEKKCIKELYVQNRLLFFSFIKRTYNKEWYQIITPLIAKEIKTMRIGDIIYENVYGYFWNHVQTSTEDVFKLVDSIKDEKTRNAIARNILRATPDYTLSIVTKWYKVLCDTLYNKADFLERALPTNPQFVLDNISELISYYIKNEKVNETARRFIEEVCNTFVKDYPDDIYPILRDVILDTINSCRVKSLNGIIDYNNAFLSFNHRYSDTIHEWFIGILKNKIITDLSTAIRDIKLLIEQNESSCYEYAFDAMIENPILFSDDIMAILKNYKLLDEILIYGDKSYYFLELLKKWFTQVASNTLEECQELICNFESNSGSISKKDSSSAGSLLPYLGYNQRKLIWAIPEKNRNSQIKRLKLELDRRFGKEWNNEKPDHDITAASICGGLMSTEQYKTVSFETWKKSFYGIKYYANGKHRFFDENVHADAFKQCVSERSEYYSDFVFNLFDDERIPDKYKMAGLEGLTIADYSTKQTLPLLWRLIDSFENLSNEGRGYRLFEIINRFTSKEGEHIDSIIEFLKKVILSEHESKYDLAIENNYDESAINTTLQYGINSIPGHAIVSLSLIGKQDKKRDMVYQFFLDSCNKLSVELQLAAMFNLRRECYDFNLYSTIMFAYANRPIADYLYLNSEIMHWFWCNDPERILPYFKMILPNKRARIILVQILFFGMEYEKTNDISKEMFEYIISQNETEILRKIIPLAYKNIDDDTYGQQSEIILRRFANDNRDEIRQTYFIYGNRLPNTQINLFKELLESWIKLPLDYGFHDIIHYIKRCCNDYPDECYQCVKLLLNCKGDKTYYDEEELIKILLSCYRSYLDYGEDKKADEVMDVFDSMMLSSYSNKMDKILKRIEENT